MGGLLWCQEGRVSKFKDLPLRKRGEGQVCCFLDEPALIFPSFAPLPFNHLLLQDPSILPHLLRDRRVQSEWGGVNLIPKQQCDTGCDSSAVINSRSVRLFSFTFLSCVLVQRKHSYSKHYLQYLSALHVLSLVCNPDESSGMFFLSLQLFYYSSVLQLCTSFCAAASVNVTVF